MPEPTSIAEDHSLDADFRRECRFTALALLLALPIFRLVEAICRLSFLPSHYDSFWHALTEDIWFSPVWWLCAEATWFGWCFSRLLIVWVVAIPVVLLLPAMPKPKPFLIAVGIVLLALQILSYPILQVRTFDGRTDAEVVWSLRSHDPEMRHNAVWAHPSFKFGVPTGTSSVMRDALRDEDPMVRQLAANFFNNHPSADAVPELTEALQDENEMVRKVARWALDKLEKPAASVPP